MTSNVKKNCGPTGRSLPHRRDVLKLAALNATAWPLATGFHTPTVRAQDTLIPLNRFPRMVQEYFVRQVRDAEKRGLREKARLQTKTDAEAYVKKVRAKIRRCFGPEPERTPLNPRVTGTVDRDAYTIEKVIFDSRPEFPVTANLYIPKNREAPAPGVVGTCGHSSNGKAMDAYQSFAQGLARQGYVCLLYDPIGQGERLQYVTDELKSRLRPGVTEHLYAGNQQFLVGEFFGMWRAWDGVRALDYLLTREEVDKRHVGVTGNSGGGTMTTWLCGVEHRWTMAAPSCFVTTFRRNMENELPADTEQCPPKALALGLDHDDFLAALAPQPIVILAKERDYFDARGTEEVYGRLQRLYGLLEAPGKIGLFIGPTYHGYSQENREAMYRWFNGATGVSDAQQEPELVIEEEQTLWCTDSGQVAELKPKTVFHFTSDLSKAFAEQRGKPRGETLINAVRTVLKLPETPERSPDYRVLRYLSGRKYPAKNAVAYAVETEPGIQALVYRLSEDRQYSRPPRGPARAVLYVAHLSSDDELRTEPLVREIMEAEPESPVYSCDVRGIGESRPETCGVNSFRNPYGSDYFYAIHSLMLDRPYLGQRTFDVLRVLDWMAAAGEHREIHLVGKGWGALCATYAALLSGKVAQVTLKNSLTSYSAIAQSEDYSWPLATFLPGVLSRFDLPDCYAALDAKKLRIIAPWDQMNAEIRAGNVE